MSKKYDIIRHESDPKVTGLKNGGSQAEILREGFLNKENYDNYASFFFSKDSMQNSIIPKAFPSFDITLEYIQMVKNAKLTDFLTVRRTPASAQFLVSKKAREILSTFAMDANKFYPVNLYLDGQLIPDYSLFHYPLLDYEHVDFSRSLFFTGTDLQGKRYYTFNSAQEFVLHCKNSGYVYCEKLFLISDYIKKLDCFGHRLAAGYYISEDLRDTFEIAEITGLKIVEAKEPELYFEE